MKILAIDFGEKKIGLALATSKIAEPLLVIKVKSSKEALSKILKVIEAEKVEKVVVGISEGKMAQASKDFCLSLRQGLLKRNIPIEMFDETLTTQEAQRLARESGVKKQKRKSMEDAYAATLMLQSYLDLCSKM